MSYTKDNNAYTRGVGAIAATDGRLKNKRRMMQARALRDRDRALSTWTMGPGGGHPGLGAISRVGMNLANPVLYGKPGSIDAPGTGITINPALPPRRGTSSGTPFLIGATAAPVAPLLIPGSVSVGKQPGRGYGTNTQPGTSVVVPPPGSVIVTDPVNGTTTITTPGPGGDSGGAVTGGGGGGVVSGGSSPVTLTPPTDVPDVPDAAGMSTTTKLLIAAGAIGALYFLTRKKGGGS